MYSVHFMYSTGCDPLAYVLCRYKLNYTLYIDVRNVLDILLGYLCVGNVGTRLTLCTERYGICSVLFMYGKYR